jgi:hypothetical protein
VVVFEGSSRLQSLDNNDDVVEIIASYRPAIC